MKISPSTVDSVSSLRIYIPHIGIVIGMKINGIQKKKKAKLLGLSEERDLEIRRSSDNQII